MILKKDNVEREATTPAAVVKLEKLGFKAVEVQTKVTETEKSASVQVGELEAMTVDQLRAVAKDLGLTGYSSLSKDELKGVILDAGNDESGED